MAIPTFEAFFLTSQSFEKENFTTQNLYQSYVLWLINQNGKVEAPVNELLFQLRIISAYVQHTLGQSENKNTDTIKANTIPEHIKTNTTSHDEINRIINKHFVDLDLAAYKAATDASTRNFKQAFNKAIRYFGAITAIIIGAAFSPQWAAAGAITLWTIGAMFGAITLMITAIRFFSDTSTPEVSLGEHKDTLRNNLKYLTNKHRAIFQAWSPYKGDTTEINNESITIKTCEALADIIPNYDKPSNPAILATVYAACDTRFSPMYEYIGAKHIEKNNGAGTEQAANLNLITQMIPSL